MTLVEVEGSGAAQATSEHAHPKAYKRSRVDQFDPVHGTPL